MTINEAKEFFISMGCSAFHMSREYPDKYTQYQALNISVFLEKKWTMESLSDKCDNALKEQWSEPFWRLHSQCAEYMRELKSTDYYSKMLKLTRFVSAKEMSGHRVIIAETINGRRDNKYRDGLIYGSYDFVMVEEAKEFARIALWIADNDSEPVPNNIYWSMERVDNARQKTKSIISNLKLDIYK